MGGGEEGKFPCLGGIGWRAWGWMEGGMGGGAPDVEGAVRPKTAGSLSSQ